MAHLQAQNVGIGTFLINGDFDYEATSLTLYSCANVIVDITTNIPKRKWLSDSTKCE